MTIVKLHGGLGREVGESFELMIRQPREAIAAIEANTGKLYRYLREHTATEYRVIVDGVDHGGIADFYLVGEFRVIEIVPVPSGSGGIWQTIIGVVLIIVGVILNVTGVGAPLGNYLIGVGISMTLGGIAQMLTKNPTIGASPLARTFRPATQQLQQKQEAPQGITNYLFSGAANTTQQGNPVSIVFGTMLIGSQLVSLAITGASLDQANIGAALPPSADDDFFDLPVWARLAADERLDLLVSQREVQRLRVEEMIDRREPFGIPEVYPVGDAKAGKPIPMGASNLPRRTLRAYLATLASIFSAAPKQISKPEAIDLYKVIGLSGLDVARATWKQIVYAIALHYSPEP
jgi:predicted phage tail protein